MLSFLAMLLALPDSNVLLMDISNHNLVVLCPSFAYSESTSGYRNIPPIPSLFLYIWYTSPLAHREPIVIGKCIDASEDCPAMKDSRVFCWQLRRSARKAQRLFFSPWVSAIINMLH
jgi:hypothetical protein